MSGNPQSAHDGGGFFGSEEELLARVFHEHHDLRLEY
jgi:alpha-glucosidase (family GH31 glycosyl hydrolase)